MVCHKKLLYMTFQLCLHLLLSVSTCCITKLLVFGIAQLTLLYCSRHATC